MINKKLFFLILLFAAVHVFPQVTASLPSVSVPIGAPVTTALTVEQFLNIGAITIRIQYDTTAVQWVGADWNSLFDGAIANAVSGKVILAWDDVAGASISNGTLVDIHFQHIAGSTPLTFLTAQCEVADINGTVISVTYTDGSISESTLPPVLFAPENGAVGVPLEPQLIWHSVPNAETYRLQISETEDFSTFVLDDSTLTDTAFVPAVLEPEHIYYWRVNAHTAAGDTPYSEIWQFTTVTSTDIHPQSGLPEAYQLFQNFPNPFNPATMIQYSIPEQSQVKIEIYNALGETIEILADAVQEPGKYSVEWNAKNCTGGVYFYRITAESETKNFTQVKKLTLVK